VQKLVIAFPFYHHISVAWFFNYLKMEKDPIIATVAVNGVSLPTAMTNLVDLAFENCPDFDRMVIFEHDMIPPLDAFNRIANYGDEYDIVGTTYFKHDRPHHVMGWMQINKPLFSPLTRDAVKMMVDSPNLYEIHGVAMGFTSIHRRVFENWDPSVQMWYPAPPFVGHDLHFCNEALKQGFRIWMDSGIGCGHLTTIPVDFDHSQEALGSLELPTWEQFIKSGHGKPTLANQGSLGATVGVVSE
jgi:hypothetical protein